MEGEAEAGRGGGADRNVWDPPPPQAKQQHWVLPAATCGEHTVHVAVGAAPLQLWLVTWHLINMFAGP